MTKAGGGFNLPPEGPLLLAYGGSPGARTLNELVVDTFGDEGPLVLHLAGEREGGKRCAIACLAEGYRFLPWTHEFGAALAAADLALARAGGSVYELAAGRHAGRPRPLPERDGRPSDEERAALRAGRRSGRRAGA